MVKHTTFLLWLLAAGVLFRVPGTSYAGESWVKTGGPPGGLGYDVRIHPNAKNVMYVTDNFSGVNRSTSAGETWWSSNTGISVRSGPTGDGYPIFSLTIDQNNPDCIWAGTQGDVGEYGVFRSDDGGATWSKKINGITLGGDIGLVFRGFTIQEGNSDVVYAQAEVPTVSQGWNFNRVRGRVFKTTDRGESWFEIWEGDNLARYLIVDPVDPDVLYLSTGIFDREAYDSDCENGVLGGEGVLKSTDGGATWTPVNNGLTDTYVGCLRMHPENPSVLYAAASGIDACLRDESGISGLYRTTDGGGSWTRLVEGNKTTVNFSPSDPDIIYAGFEDAFFRSEDGGSTWSRFTRPSGGSYGPLGVIAGIPIDVIVDPDDPYTLYVNNYGGGVFRSTDGAETWEVWSRGYTGADVLGVHAMEDDPATVYAVTTSGPFVSYDGGGEWIGIANGDASEGSLAAGVFSMAVHPGDPHILFISSSFHGVIYRSGDGGGHFSQVFQHPECTGQDVHQGFRTMTFAPSDPDVMYAGVAWSMEDSHPAGTVIFHSSDTGLTWTEKPSIVDGKNVNCLAVHPQDPLTVFAATSGGIYRTADGDMSGLTTRAVSDLSLSGGGVVLYAATQGEGVFRWGEVPTGVGEDDTSPLVERAFSVSQNYPNPFNPLTTVGYEVPARYLDGVRVVIEVFTARGRKVKTLVDERKSPGSHTVLWDGRDDRGEAVGSGVYLYRLTIGPHAAVRKMVLFR